MTCRADVGRADLIRWCVALDEDRFRRVAEALGYREEPEPATKQDVVASFTGRVGPPAASPASTAEGIRYRHYRLVERRALTPPSPPSPVEVLPLPDEEEPVVLLGPSPPLMPWPRLWPFLRAACAAQQAASPTALAKTAPARPER